MATPGEIRVQDEQGNIHVFPGEATPEMIAQAMNVKPPTSAPGTVTGDVANIGVNRNTSSAPPFRRFSGSFLERAESAGGQALQDPKNFLPSWKMLFPPLMAAESARNEWNQIKNPAPPPDPAETVGGMLPAILASAVMHSGDSMPNVGDLAGKDISLPTPLSRGLQAGKNMTVDAIKDVPFLKQVLKARQYYDKTAPTYPGAPLPANPYELVQRSAAKRELINTLSDEADRASQLESPSYPGAPLPAAPEVTPVKTKIGGRFVLSPEEAQQAAQIQRIAKRRASERGMQYAAGMKPSGGKLPTP